MVRLFTLLVKGLLLQDSRFIKCLDIGHVGPVEGLLIMEIDI